MKNKVLFDLSVCQPSRESKFHGGGVYGYIVFKKLAQKYPTNIVAYYDYNRFIDPEIEKLLKEKGIVTIDSYSSSIINAYNQTNCNLIYSPLYSSKHDTAIDTGVPMILTIHGLRPLEMNRDKYEYKYSGNIRDLVKSIVKQTPYFNILNTKYTKRYQKLFDASNVSIITVSEHSKASIKYYYPNIDEKSIKVRYSPNTSLEYDLNSRTRPEEDYILVLSANRWLKNGYRAIKAFDKLVSKHLSYNKKLYIVGLNPNSSLLKGITNKERIRCFKYLDRESLEYYLKNAYCLLYPTLNEGFGYPPLEAMRYGVPVITSPLASVSEICGESVLYANPYSIDEIGIRLIQLENSDLYKKYQTLSKSRVKFIKDRQDNDLELLTDEIINNL